MKNTIIITIALLTALHSYAKAANVESHKLSQASRIDSTFILQINTIEEKTEEWVQIKIEENTLPVVPIQMPLSYGTMVYAFHEYETTVTWTSSKPIQKPRSINYLAMNN